MLCFLVGKVDSISACHTEDWGLIPQWGKSAGFTCSSVHGHTDGTAEVSLSKAPNPNCSGVSGVVTIYIFTQDKNIMVIIKIIKQNYNRTISVETHH